MSMNIKRFSNAESFLERAEVYLKNQEIINNIMLGVCNNLKNNKALDKDNFFAVVEEDGEIRLAAMMTPPKNITMYSDNEKCSDAIELIVDNLLSEYWKISGVVASKNISKQFADLWSKLTGCEIRKSMNMRIYELREVIHPKYNQGKFRAAELKDLDLIQDWTYKMETEIGTAGTKERSYEMAERKVLAGDVFVWEDKEVVSMAAKARPTGSGIVVNMVYTPKEFRKRGYASFCVAALSQHLLDAGYKFCALFTDLANPISNSIYMKMGYKPVCDMDEYKFSIK